MNIQSYSEKFDNLISCNLEACDDSVLQSSLIFQHFEPTCINPSQLPQN